MPNQPAAGTTLGSESPTAPLAGMTVLSLVDGRLPALGRTLAEFGADIEVVGPVVEYTDEIRRLVETRGKRFTHPEPAQLGGYVTTRLGDIHVLITSPEALQEAGLPTAEAIAARLPDLVIAVVTDFGRTGPRAGWRGSEAVFHALSGSLSRSGRPGRAPLIPPGELFSRSAAVQIAWTLVAVLYRATEGRGGAVLDCSIFEAGAVSLDPAYGMMGSGTPDIINAYGRPAAAHLYPIYRTSDGFVRLCVLAKGQWASMIEWMGHPPELADPELVLTQVRQENPELVQPYIGAFVAGMSTEDVVRECRERRIPACAVLAPADVLSEPHFLGSGVLTEIGRLGGRPIVVAEGMARINGVRTAPRHGRSADRGFEVSNRHVGPYPLSGVTVLDLGIIVAGSVASELYAELGARVIRIENTGFPDGMRRDFNYSTPSQARGHRGKESLGLDLRSETGRAIFLELAASADLVVSNFKPGTLERLRIAYRDLTEVNPRIVCVESTAFGDSGPWQTAMGYGPLVRAGDANTWLWRADSDDAYFADGITIFPDHLVGRVCALSALACLLDRRRTGRGAHVTVAQCDVGLIQLDELLAAESVSPGAAQPPGVLPGRRRLSEVVLPAAGADQWCIVDPLNAEQVASLRAVVGAQHRDLDTAVAEWVIRQPSADDATARLQAAGVPAARMIRHAEMAEDPALLARQLYRPTAVTGTQDEVLVERFSVPRESLAVPSLEPMAMFGAHTRAVLTELGKDPAEIDGLFGAGIAQACAAVEPQSAGVPA